MNSLETLRWTVSQEMEIPSIFWDAPNLCKVFIDLRSYSKWCERLDPTTIPMPWPQFTHIHLSGSLLFTPAGAFALLRRSVNLKDCFLGITEDTRGPPHSDPITATLPALESFVVEDKGFRFVINGQPPLELSISSKL